MKINTPNQKAKRHNSYTKIFSIPLATLLLSTNVALADITTNKTTNDLVNNFTKSIPNNINNLNKEKIAKLYIENNLFVNGKAINDDQFDYSIKTIGEDKYQITYTHQFDGINNFAEPSEKKTTLNISFYYENNNIFVKIDNVNIGQNDITENDTILINHVIYDYKINEGVDKSVNLNTKANKYKTNKYIKEKIINKKFTTQTNIPKFKELENTQINKLNEINLGQEVFGEGDKYYREIYLIENNKYRTINKIYFDKYGELILDNNKQNKLETTKILGVDVKYTLIKTPNNISLNLDKNSLKKLTNKIKEQRSTIMNIINNAKVGPNTAFSGFNKIKGERDWSHGEDIRGFDTKLISLTLIDDTYIFQRGSKKENSIYFGITPNKNGIDNIFLKNLNNDKVDEFFITIKNDYYRVSLINDELSIIKIKKEETNIYNNLPSYNGEKKIKNILNNQNNNTNYTTAYNNKNTLNYRNIDGTQITSISAKKDDEGNYKLQDNITTINLTNLYADHQFKKLTNKIKELQQETNTLDIDIFTGLKTLLTNNGIDLTKRKAVKVTNENKEVFYCTINDKCSIKKDNNLQIEKDQKLYKSTKDALEIIEKRLEVVKMLNNTKIKWQNNGKEIDFKAFIGGGRGIGTRNISQTNIIQFISKKTNELELNIVWGEGENTTIIYDLSPNSWKMKIKGKKKISIAGQDYSIVIDKDRNILLNPIEK